MKAAVLGAGAWGTALAKLLAEQGATVSLWTRRADLSDDIRCRRENVRYLPGVGLPSQLSTTHHLEVAARGADAMIFVVPSHATREVARAAAPYITGPSASHPGTLVISATKGIEADTLKFMDEVLFDELPPESRGRCAFLSGPSFARELADGVPTAVVFAARDADVCADAMRTFRAPHLRTYASNDVAGVACGGAVKNVIAIAAGAAQGLGFGHNTRAAIITRGLAEVARLAVARGGSALTMAGLAGLGDLVLTCTGELSRNRTVGYELGRGHRLADVLLRLGHVAEGVQTTKSVHALSRKLGVDMPITSEVHAVLFEEKQVQEALRDLMGREMGYEFDPRATVRFTQDDSV